MFTSIVEFKNNNRHNLRGILRGEQDVLQCDHLVLCLAGFEGHASTKIMFKEFSDQVVAQKKGVFTFCLDYQGIGLSDGPYDIFVESMVNDCLATFEALKASVKFNRLSVFGHSLGGCVVSELVAKHPALFDKIILLAPALNQQDLLRYYHVRDTMKISQPEQKITWENWQEFLDEKSFQDFVYQGEHPTKKHILDATYFVENQDKSYENFTEEHKNKMLVIHGTKDSSVPLESLQNQYSNNIIIKGGDHHLEFPTQMEQWVSKAVNFIIS